MRGQGPLPSPAEKRAEGGAGHQAGSAKDIGPVSSSSSSRNPPHLQTPCSPGMNLPLLEKAGPQGPGTDGGDQDLPAWRATYSQHSVHAHPQPWASDSTRPPAPHPCRPTFLTQHLSAESPAQHLETGREGETETEGGEERRLFCPAWLLCRPRAPTATPTPILAQLGQGGGSGKGGGRQSKGESWDPTPGFLPSVTTPPRPRGGVSGRVRDATDTTPPQEEEPRAGRMSRDPPGSRDARQAGGGRAAAGVGDCRGQPDTTNGMLVPPSLCPSRAAPLWAALRPGGRC